MDDMVSLSLGGLIGAVTGLATGYYFERRVNANVREENDDLRRQLSVLQTLLYSLGAHRERIPSPDKPAVDLAGSVTERALATQDAAGRVDRNHLIAYFVEHGDDAAAVEAAIDSLCRSGAAREEGEWLQLT